MAGSTECARHRHATEPRRTITMLLSETTKPRLGRLHLLKKRDMLWTYVEHNVPRTAWPVASACASSGIYMDL